MNFHTSFAHPALWITSALLLPKITGSTKAIASRYLQGVGGLNWGNSSAIAAEANMESSVYQVDAFWDEEAAVWVATSEDVPGLATEADTIEALSQKLRDIIPDLLFSNQFLSKQDYQKLFNDDQVKYGK